MNCHSCGTALSATARYCHKCGASVRASTRGRAASDWRAGLPWGLAGLAIGALATVLAMRSSGSSAPPGENGAAPAPGRSTLDISQMSTEEMARRLFDRVMRLAEEGKRDSVAFFAPMALQTYASLPALDNDARYDIGLLELAAGNAMGALAQADTLISAVPTHLYAFVLRAQAHDVLSDAPRARRAYADFLKHDAAERARARPEYQAHASTLDTFRRQALARSAGSGQ